MAAIEFEGVWKRYWGGPPQQAAWQALRTMFKRDVSGPGSFWAVKDVSFSVEPGKTLGIIGPNGAGKTTILRLLAGIAAPTRGTVRTSGRIGALINLGAGFHPELTGLENIYLGGVIMGMSRHEIRQKLNSIVEFSGLEERFLHMPVKRYSAGMYARLGFSVSVVLDPDVLLVDEVLAVGDVAFRAKCYRKMAEIRKSDCAVVLVSHSVHAVQNVCDRTLLMWEGQPRALGPTDDVLSEYLALMDRRRFNSQDESLATAKLASAQETVASEKASIREVRILGANGQEVTTVESGEMIRIQILYTANTLIPTPVFAVDFYDFQELMTGYYTHLEPDENQPGPIFGSGMAELVIHHLNLPTGVYHLTVHLSEDFGYNSLDWHRRAYVLQVIRPRKARGRLSLDHTWRFVAD